jgi:hypothetical protein
MKRLVTFVFTGVLAFNLSSCKDQENLNGKFEEQLKDSVFKNLPTVASVHVEVKDGHQLTLILGSKDLFEGSEKKRMDATTQLNTTILQIFNKENGIEGGKLYISEDEKSDHPDLTKARAYLLNMKAANQNVNK